MPKKSPQVDAYISRSADFAKPILTHFRKLVHAACPDVEETIKWRFPFFQHHGILCAMPAFKHHCSIVFWRPSIRQIAGNLRKLTKLSDLPKPAELKKLIKQAAALNESGEKPKRPTPAKKPLAKKPLAIPPYFTKALKKNKKAEANFNAFSPSHKKEFVQWIVGAKQEETRQRRIAQMLQMLAKGKSRNWKYENY